jgi:hypothetical protein
MKKFGLIIAFLLIFLCPPAMSEQVYTWIDESGVKHFTNDPPPEGATLIETTKEIQQDEAKDQKHTKSREQSSNALEPEERASDKEIVEKTPPKDDDPEAIILQEMEDNDARPGRKKRIRRRKP